MAPFFNPGKKLLSHLSSNHPNWTGNSKSCQHISNLSFISKSIKKAAVLHLSIFFEDWNLLPTYQSAYCKRHSTETAVLNICDKILQNAEHNKGTTMVCLNLSTTFDTVNQTILKKSWNIIFILRIQLFSG